MSLRALVLGSSLLAACAGGATSGPAWPRAHEAEKDGGESLAPHLTTQVAAAIAASPDSKPAAPAAVAAVTAPAAAPAETGSAAAPSLTTPDEVMIEDTVIEVDE